MNFATVQQPQPSLFFYVLDLLPTVVKARNQLVCRRADKQHIGSGPFETVLLKMLREKKKD